MAFLHSVWKWLKMSHLNFSRQKYPNWFWFLARKFNYFGFENQNVMKSFFKYLNFGAKKIENTHSRLFEWFSNTMMLASSGNLWLLWNRLVKCVEAWISRIIRKTWANTTLTKKMYSTWNMYYLLLHSVSKLSKKVSISNNASKYFKNDFLTFWLLKSK